MARTICGILLFLSFLIPGAVAASGIAIGPLLIDETLEPRDTVERTIALTNEYTDRKLVVFATVNEISVETTGEIKEFISPVMTDRTNTVTSWAEITRGRIEIDPGATVEVPLTLRIHPYAQSGTYHMFIGFVPESKRPEAEAVALRGDADGVIVKVTIADNKTATLRLSNFLIERFVVSENDADFSITLQNTGDAETIPQGEVIVYDTTGHEIGSVPLNIDQAPIPAGGEVTLTQTLPPELSLGRFKATLALRYGENQAASVADTTFFYSLPLPILLAVGGGLFIAIILMSILIHRMMREEHDATAPQEVVMRVRDTHDAKPKDHDIDLSSKV